MIRSWLSPAHFLVALLLAFGCAAVWADAPPVISLAEYRTRLEAMDRLVAGCQQAVNAANCKSDAVGADVRIQLGQEKRDVRFFWLRDALDAVVREQAEPKKAADKKPDSSASEGKSARERADFEEAMTIPERLQTARDRLHEDWLRAGGAGSSSADTAQRQALTRILSQKQYQYAVERPTLWERVRQKISVWLDKTFGALAEIAPKARWIGRAVQIGIVLAVCIGLVWFLIGLERRNRLALQFHPEVGKGAPSERDWQLWLQDARRAAAQGAWREAIHLVYWASISRLESSGQWPADRARTPREYLALVGEESSQRPTLAALTRAFERTWYAGQSAGEADFERAEELAGSLGAR